MTSMADLFLIIPILASFLVTLFFIPRWIKKAHEIRLVWDDMNKLKNGKVAGSGGIIVAFGFIIGILLFVAYRVFILKTPSYLIEILSAVLVILIASGVGLIDDLFGWQKGGLSRRSRLVLVFFAAIPMMVINAGKSVVSLPFFDQVDLGLAYPLLLVPIGIVGATTTYNFLAGYNGLEAGQGIILLTAISIVSFLTGNTWLSIISLCMIASLLAFLLFNFYPAKVFPGDSLTYAVGSLIAITSILGNFERIAIFFFIPYILETFLKLRGKLIKHSFSKPNGDGTIDLKYDKIYGLEHLSILLFKKFKIKPTEKKVVYSIWFFQVVIVILGFIIFQEHIFT